jgi:hypothetical protein
MRKWSQGPEATPIAGLAIFLALTFASWYFCSALVATIRLLRPRGHTSERHTDSDQDQVGSETASMQ